MKINLEQIKLEKEELFTLVKDFFKDEKKAEDWFQTENLNFGGTTPNNLIFMGRADRLKQFIVNALYENKRI